MTEPVIQTEAVSFYEGAYGRIVRLMFGLAVVLTVSAVARFGVPVGAGFAVGCAIAILNFHWLKRVVSALADRATGTGRRQRSTGVVMRFLLRYLLVAAAAYAIFRVSTASLYGLLAGLFLPVAAILLEAVYEVGAAVLRGE